MASVSVPKDLSSRISSRFSSIAALPFLATAAAAPSVPLNQPARKETRGSKRAGAQCESGLAVANNGEERAPRVLMIGACLLYRLGDFKIGLGGEQFLGLRHAAQCITADRHHAAAHFRGERVDKARRKQHILFDRPAHRQNPADLVYGRADHREIEAILAADITVEDIPDMKREID